jgi:hypothetical protein
MGPRACTDVVAREESLPLTGIESSTSSMYQAITVIELTQIITTKTLRSGSKAPLILNLDNRVRRTVSFKLQSLYPRRHFGLHYCHIFHYIPDCVILTHHLALLLVLQRAGHVERVWGGVIRSAVTPHHHDATRRYRGRRHYEYSIL